MGSPSCGDGDPSDTSPVYYNIFIVDYQNSLDVLISVTKEDPIVNRQPVYSGWCHHFFCDICAIFFLSGRPQDFGKGYHIEESIST